MTRPGYIKVSNDIGGSQEALDLPEDTFLAGIGLYVACLGYCDRQRTDGRIPRRALRVIAPGIDCGHVVADLERVGFLESTPDGWTIPGYLDWQRSREQIENASEKGRRASNTRWRREGDAERDASSNAQCNASGNAQCNASGSAQGSAQGNAPNQPTRQPTRAGSAPLLEDPQESEDPLTADARRIPCWDATRRRRRPLCQAPSQLPAGPDRPDPAEPRSTPGGRHGR